MVPPASIFHLKILSKRVQLAITIKPAMKTYRRPLEKVMYLLVAAESELGPGSYLP